MVDLLSVYRRVLTDICRKDSRSVDLNSQD